MWGVAMAAMHQQVEGQCKCACQCGHEATEKFYRSDRHPPLPLCSECYEEWIEPSWWE
jgi:hypothetical protein